ncbi:globin domain-containing protein [Pelagibius sp. Alg239-R121]|uniref:globin domain-containing protein n=1 Tax=Pelagibius sp. Alg239-R121 TaxID=2993448 RepID=UPI0024A61DA0|nr:globin domain-containing protein [Pelagibius sp. Alg239-R121]
MELTQREIDLVRSSFRIVLQDTERVTDRFYRNLFKQAPQTRALFVNDLGNQSVRVMSQLGLVVSQLQSLEDLTPVLRSLAIRHVGYGVKPEHYSLVGRALLQTLAEVLDERFTSETRLAWITVYSGLSTLMKEAAYGSYEPSRYAP